MKVSWLLTSFICCSFSASSAFSNSKVGTYKCSNRNDTASFSFEFEVGSPNVNYWFSSELVTQNGSAVAMQDFDQVWNSKPMFFNESAGGAYLYTDSSWNYRADVVFPSQKIIEMECRLDKTH